MILDIINPEGFDAACCSCRARYRPALFKALGIGRGRTRSEGYAHYAAITHRLPPVLNRMDDCGADCFFIPTYIGDDGAE